MTLRKDDPVYYKKKITELIEQAKNQGLEVSLESVNNVYLLFKDVISGDIGSINLGKLQQNK